MMLKAIEGPSFAGKTTRLARYRDKTVIHEILDARRAPPHADETSDADIADNDHWFLSEELERWRTAVMMGTPVILDRCVLSQLIHWEVRRKTLGIETAVGVHERMAESLEGDLSIPALELLLPPFQVVVSRRAARGVSDLATVAKYQSLEYLSASYNTYRSVADRYGSRAGSQIWAISSEQAHALVNTWLSRSSFI